MLKDRSEWKLWRDGCLFALFLFGLITTIAIPMAVVYYIQAQNTHIMSCRIANYGADIKMCYSGDYGYPVYGWINFISNVSGHIIHSEKNICSSTVTDALLEIKLYWLPYNWTCVIELDGAVATTISITDNPHMYEVWKNTTIPAFLIGSTSLAFVFDVFFFVVLGCRHLRRHKYRSINS